MAIEGKSALGRLPPRSNLTTSLTNRPRPETAATTTVDTTQYDAAPEGDLLANDATEARYETEAPVETKVIAEGLKESGETLAPAPRPGAPTNAIAEATKRRGRGPARPKTVSLDPGTPVDLGALKARARELEVEGKRLVAEHQSALLRVNEEFRKPIEDLRQEYVSIQAEIAKAAF